MQPTRSRATRTAGRIRSLACFQSLRAELLRRNEFACEPVPFEELREWSLVDGVLRHATRGFFAISGLETEANHPAWHGLETPIIDQRVPALIGLLLTPGQDGSPDILMQARAEPGNVGGIQLAPTVQSTQANYTRRHGGRPTAFLAPFLDGEGEALADQFQSEEGGRYFMKFNRCVVRQVAPVEAGALPETHVVTDWQALRGFTVLDNILNTDGRSALACCPWPVLAGPAGPFAGPDGWSRALARSFAATARAAEQVAHVLGAVALARIQLRLAARLKPLSELRDWEVTTTAIQRRDGNPGFVIRPYRVVARGREVPEWDQPLFDSQTTGRIVLLCCEIDGILRFALRLSREIGLMQGVELGPSFARPPGEAAGPEDTEMDAACASRGATMLARFRQSEEGGRFFQDENIYEVLHLADPAALPDLPDLFLVTLGELKALIDTSGTCTIELRCAVSALMRWL